MIKKTSIRRYLFLFAFIWLVEMPHIVVCVPLKWTLDHRLSIRILSEFSYYGSSESLVHIVLKLFHLCYAHDHVSQTNNLLHAIDVFSTFRQLTTFRPCEHRSIVPCALRPSKAVCTFWQWSWVRVTSPCILRWHQHRLIPAALFLTEHIWCTMLV